MRLFLKFTSKLKPNASTIKLWVSLLCIMGGMYSSAVKSEKFDSNELNLKILYLYNFSKLTQWPKSTFDTQTADFNICIYGNKRYASAAKSLRKKKIKQRTINTLTITTSEQVSACQTLFIANEKEAMDFIRQAYRHNVLTVSDSSNFIKNGGIIKLLKINNKIRFEINIGSINNKKLEISSKLLRLAKAVHRKKILD